MRSPPLTATPGPQDRLEPGHRDFDGVGVGGHVGHDEIAGGIGDDRGHSRTAGFTDERHGRAGHRQALIVLDRAGHGAGGDLSRNRMDGECTEHERRHDSTRANTPLHVSLLGRGLRPSASARSAPARPRGALSMVTTREASPAKRGTARLNTVRHEFAAVRTRRCMKPRGGTAERLAVP